MNFKTGGDSRTLLCELAEPQTTQKRGRNDDEFHYTLRKHFFLKNTIYPFKGTHATCCYMSEESLCMSLAVEFRTGLCCAQVLALAVWNFSNVLKRKKGRPKIFV